MPSIQKIALALAFSASVFAAEISDGQIQQLTTPVAIITPVVKQITDGQIQQPTSTPVAVVAPAVNQINDGQIQQVTSTPVAVIAPALKQINDGQVQQVTSTPVAVVAPAVKQITDGQVQQLASASVSPSPSANVTSITTPSAPAATFQGAASLMSYSMELATVAIGAAALFAML